MKKKILTGLLFLLCITLSLLTLASCEDAAPAKPENLRYDGATISWDAVENAGKYTVRINDSDPYEVTDTKFPYAAKGATFTVKVTAVSGGKKATSSPEAVMSFSPLAAVETIEVSEDGVISWSAVESATGYRLRIVNGTKTEEVTVDGTSYAELPDGANKVSIKPVVSGNNAYYSVWSKEQSVKICGTVSVDSISYEDGKIVWTGVSDARLYRLSINGQVYEVTENQYRYDADNHDFTVAVQAIGNHSTSYDGRVSETKSFVYLDTVTNIRVEDGILHWDAVQNADAYKLRLNGSLYPKTLTDLSFNGLSVNLSTDVEILPISNNSTYFSSWSAPKSVLILASPVLRWNSDYELDGEANSNLYWDGIANASGYAVRVTYPDTRQEVIPAGETQRFFQEAYLQVGTYKVEVKALAATDSAGIYDSAYSTPITVTRLPAPKAAAQDFILSNPDRLSDGFTVTFNRVEGASGYRLYRDNVPIKSGTTTSFTDSSMVDETSIGEQTFNYMVQALGTVKTVSGKIEVTLGSLSADSLSFRITVLSAPTSPSMNGFKYSFGEVSKSHGYSVNVGGKNYTAENTEFDLGLVLAAGSYAIKVCARGNGTDVLASNFADPLNLVRLEAPRNVRIDTTEASDGTLTYDTILHALSYYIVFNNDGQTRDAAAIGNMNQYITTEGTSIYMQSAANYYSTDRTVYYMTSQPGTTMMFIKLAAPTFGDVAFSNNRFNFKAPSNLNTQIYTPTYQISDANGVIYDGEANGTSFDISNLPAGTFTFRVRAVGDGKNYVNSEWSVPQTITKLASPEVRRENGRYVWNVVPGATSYTLYVDGVVKMSVNQDGTLEYVPDFNEIKTYQVSVVAVGDNGYTTINSNPTVLEQKTLQLTTPDFTFAYSGTEFDLDGELQIRITVPSKYATGYVYSIGGAMSSDGISAEEYYSRKANGVGKYIARVYAKGGAFDENGVYYLDSQSRGGSDSYSVTLLSYPNPQDFTLSRTGVLKWSSIAGAVKYEVQISVDDGEFTTYTVNANSPTFTIENFDTSHKYTVRIRAVGNGTTVITSEQKERTWESGL